MECGLIWSMLHIEIVKVKITEVATAKIINGSMTCG